MTESAMVVRKCHNLDEMSACVALQKEVWNFAEAELVPLRVFVVAEKIGGQVIGAFDDGRLVAFALSLPGSRGGHSYLHSQMLAVRSEYRNAGLGRQIKLVSAGRRPRPGIRIDRVDIRSPRNQERLFEHRAPGCHRAPLQRQPVRNHLFAAAGRIALRPAGGGMVAEVEAGGDACCADAQKPGFETLKTISVPAEIYEWKASPATRERAREVQDCNRRDFLQAFSDGLAVLGYERDQQGAGKFLLGRWDESWIYPS